MVEIFLKSPNVYCPTVLSITLAKTFELLKEHLTTVHPNEIVPRRGPPSVDHEESDSKVSHSYIAI